MITKKIYICEDSIEGIFTAIYDAWSSRYGHNNIRIDVQAKHEVGIELELFSEYITVNTDMEKAIKVAKSIQTKISEDVYELICNTAWSNADGKGDIIYRFLILGYAMGKKIVDYIQNDTVLSVFNINRNFGNEVHHFKGFIRFQEIQNKILLAKINPKNDILRSIAPHFTDRFNSENFLIYDEKRKTAIIHQCSLPWIYTSAANFKMDELMDLSDHEEEFQLLWKTFFESIAIEDRKNSKLQQNNLPKRFRSNMIEFSK